MLRRKLSPLASARFVRTTGVSFLELQDLATVAAQTDIAATLSNWWRDSDELFSALEAGFGACLIALAIRRRAKH
jgi:hypothetical protein